MKFKDLELNPEMQKALKEMNFFEATDVQEDCMDYVISGKDIMVQSKTGSGKTAVFLISIAKAFMNNKDSKALVIAPTRELAIQISDEANRMFKYITGVKVGCFYGGVGYEKQNKLIEKGVNVVIGTPGRIIDFEKSKKYSFSDFNVIAIDEADRLFDMGFYQDIDYIFSNAKPANQRFTAIFSATLSTKVRNIAWKFMNDPVEIEVNPEEITVEAIEQRLYHVNSDEKFKILLGLLKQEDKDQVLIFANTKRESCEITRRLKENGYKAEFLTGDMMQNKRQQTLNKFKEGKISILVATDVAARGLQIDDLPLVINYDIPEDYENYVHRIGRTARAGKTGVALTLACEKYIYGLEAIQDYINQKIPVVWIEESFVESIVDNSKKKTYHSNNKYQKNNRKPKTSYKKKDYKKKDYKKPSVNINSLSIEDKAAYYAKMYGSDMKKAKKEKKEVKLTLWQKIKRIFKK